MSNTKLCRILAEFLASSKRSYLSAIRSASEASKNKWTVVMGNESGDLDTIACAIAYAYHQTHHLRKPTIPLIRTHPSDLKLRAENIYALALAGVDDPETQLLLLSDIPKDKWSQREFSLVDHNKLGSEFNSSGTDGKESRVVAVIDHHEDEGLYTDTAEPRLVSPTGSCASHVVAYILHNSPPDCDISTSIPPEISTLLLSAILIDTSMKPVYGGGKATELDLHVAALLAPHAIFPDEISDSDIALMTTALSEVKQVTSALLPLSTSQSPSPSPTSEIILQSLRASSPIRALLDNLVSKKLDVSHLNVPELLRRDYKEYDHTVAISSDDKGEKVQIKVGLSTVPVRLAKWAGTSASEEGNIDLLLQDGATYMKERGLSVLGVLTTFRKEKRKNGAKGKKAREMAWLIRTDLPSSSAVNVLAQRIFTGLEANDELSVKPHKQFKQFTKPSSKSHSDDTSLHARHNGLIVRVYKQRNANATRKATAPILRQILEDA
ncbi:hypothetical protein E1B28_006507 [Marasmius oreades]|uniref:DHHA2 domain-containing protein n=1 Tax=Marasmius oreades TaxID=181124 RepID=A0A9P7UVC7_9AGAR|nr:uncharacterized protein E1B28_006507 [Marasmius oreades]KAG7095807.1 hypothetical protein E1B28_006507 [Marasmius oreades]